MNLANRITVSRLFLAGALFVLLVLIYERVLAPTGPAGWLALAIFVVASGSDWLDGYVARRYGMVTPLGRILDPFVDKVVVCGSYIFLTVLFPQFVPPWLVVITVGREFLVNGMRGYLEARGVSFGARMPGKLKMTLQCLSIGGVLLMSAMGDDNLHRSGFDWSGAGVVSGGTLILLWGGLLLAIYSGGFYAMATLRKLQELGA